ncbi:hypothetical protein GCM10009530_64030 [Microbispora corallina]|uniref:Uncharacterized protein n=1 Tax=Microbispora corallina TaxID=83302 RepID=A0ABQ4GCC4_9ACTN|nr:hypothetical protein [Microbispora corallina]GIH44714.1 hypothetical protein Mco01_77140 [Microbispora corallina]
MATRKLGRRPPKHAPALRLSRVLTGKAPAHPAAADHFAQVGDWGLYTNDKYGVCGPTSVANQRKLVSRYLGGAEQSPTLADVYDLYRRSGNPTFDPKTGAGDGGVDMQTMLEALLAGGIGGARPLAFAAVDHSNLDELRAAIAIFGSLLFGVDLETAQEAQTDAGLWDYRRSGEWGGHAVLAGRYVDTTPDRADRTGVISWAQVVDATDAFLQHQLGEAWVVIWPEHLGARAFQEGVDLAALAAAYEELTGRPFPAAPQPAPAPGPPPGDVDHVLAQAMRSWLSAKGL